MIHDTDDGFDPYENEDEPENAGSIALTYDAELTARVTGNGGVEIRRSVLYGSTLPLDGYERVMEIAPMEAAYAAKGLLRAAQLAGVKLGPKKAAIAAVEEIESRLREEIVTLESELNETLLIAYDSEQDAAYYRAEYAEAVAQIDGLGAENEGLRAEIAGLQARLAGQPYPRSWAGSPVPLTPTMYQPTPVVTTAETRAVEKPSRLSGQFDHCMPCGKSRAGCPGCDPAWNGDDMDDLA